jgi:thioredoxin reductase
MQLFEVVSAAPVEDRPGSPRGRQHAVVRADMCVGCGTCVAACPEPGALRLEGKLAVVEKAKCVGHGHCVEACPVRAIVLTSGEAVHRVEVPLVHADFQSNVRGVYIVGELGGRGLIKNAVNEGKIAIECIVRELASGGLRESAADGVVDVVVVGSGPAGLSAGLEAHRCGLSYKVLEQGTIADSIRRYPRHKILLAEPVKIPLYGDLWVADAAKETLLEIWETIIANTGLDVTTGCRVENVVREGPFLCVHTASEVFRARRVVLATGRRGTPRRLEVPGEELGKVFYDIAEMEAFRERRLLVVGGGESAIESALGLANQAGTDVTLCYRGDVFSRVRERNSAKLADAIQEKRIRALLRSQVREIRSDSVVLDVGDRDQVLPNDNVIVRIGGELPVKFLERIGVRMVKKDLPLPSDAEAAVA